MSLHIEIGSSDRMAIIEAIGTGEDIAAELTAAVGVIYTQLAQTERSVGSEFRAALTAMVRADAHIWTAAEEGIPGGHGRCIVYMPPGSLEG